MFAFNKAYKVFLNKQCIMMHAFKYVARKCCVFKAAASARAAILLLPQRTLDR